MSHTTMQAQADREERRFAVLLGARGRMVLPAPVRRSLDLHEGDRLILTVEDSGVLRLVSARNAATAARGMLRRLTEGQSLVDELLRERREEAERE